MGRAALSEQEIQSSRDRLVEVAARFSARDGHAGITLRVIARELAPASTTCFRICSPP